MSRIKVITICGSMRFKKEMIQIAEELELKRGYVVIQCVYAQQDRQYDKSEKEKLSQIHFKKIEISDAIYVVNVNGYIGEATRREIEYAKSLNKEILSLQPLDE